MTSLGSVLYLLLLLLMVCWPTGCQVDVRGEVQEEGRLLNDFHFLSVFIDDRNNNDAFSLHLSTLPTWKTRAEKFFESYGPEVVKRTHLSVQNLLKEHEVEESKLLADWPTAFRTDLHLQTDLQTDRTDLKHAPRELTTSSVLRTLNTGVVWDVESTTLSSKHVQKHKAYRKVKARQTLFAEHNQPRPNHASILDLIAPQKQSTLPVFLREIASPIVLYQSLNTSTGGTTAMRLLYHALKDMHYQHVLLCNESNYLTKACRRPSDRSVVVTGEWCHGVMDEYFNPANIPSGHYQYRGRGLQYHLGFHVGRDMCRGFVSTAVSHGLLSLLGTRAMHAYYLASPMSENIHKNFDAIVRHVFDEHPSRETVEKPHQQQLLEIEKEDLVMIDSDYITDYPPEVPIALSLDRPVRRKLILQIRPDHMPMFYQRARAVMDLALPGAERVCAEGILYGAIPIVSHRWMGASDIDFPVYHKIDALNPATAIAAIDAVLDNYEAELSRAEHKAYFKDVVSLKSQLMNTVDRFFSSASFHFTFIATSLEEEYWMNLQVMTVFYLFPLASVDVYVRDMLWYHRHHYLFLDLLKQAGYLSIDLVDPKESSYNIDNHGNKEDGWKSYFSIKPLMMHYSHFVVSKEELSRIGNSDMVPDWKPVFVYVPQGVVFTSAEAILSYAVDGFEKEDIRVFSTSTKQTNVTSSMVVVASPYANFTDFTLFWKEILHLRVGPILHHYYAEESLISDSVNVQRELQRNGYLLHFEKEEDVISICDLWQRSVDGEQFQDGVDSLVEGVRNTSSWKMLMQQMAEFKQPLCL